MLAIRYIYEVSRLRELSEVCKTNTVAVQSLPDGPEKIDLEATFVSHQANLAESIGNAAEAIQLNLKLYETRRYEEPQNKDLFAWVCNSLGYCHDTRNQHDKAMDWFMKVESFTLNVQPVIQVSTARCMIDHDDLESAAKLLDVAICRMQREEQQPSNSAMLA